MNSEMIKFFLSSGVPCGFADSEGEIKANAKMVDFLGSSEEKEQNPLGFTVTSFVMSKEMQGG